VDGNGNFLPANFLQSYDSIKSFLKNASSDNMANALSAQLLTTEINIKLGLVNPATSIFVPAVTVGGVSMSNSLQNTLIDNDVSNSGGVANIQTIIDASIAELMANPCTFSAGPDRHYEKALRDLLEA